MLGWGMASLWMLGWGMASHWSLTGPSSADEAERLFMCLVAICMFSLGTVHSGPVSISQLGYPPRHHSGV